MQTFSTKKRRSGVALIIGIFLMLAISTMSIYLLEKIIPGTENIKWVEFSTAAYYQARSGYESALLGMSGSTPGLEPTSTVGNTQSGYVFSVRALGSILPGPGLWNSDFDPTKGWNLVRPGVPIQFKVRAGSLHNGAFQIYLRIPDFNRDGTVGGWNDGTLSGATGSGLFAWELSWSGASAFSNVPGAIKFGAVWAGGGISLDHAYTGLNHAGTVSSFLGFYSAFNCAQTVDCTIKLTLIAPLVLTDGTSIPGLEYQVVSTSGGNIPYQYSTVTTSGRSKGFERTFSRNVLHSTVNEAFDFTVFQ